MTVTGTMASFDPRRRIEPLPNCFSIWLSVLSKMRARSLSSIRALTPVLERSLYRESPDPRRYNRMRGSRIDYLDCSVRHDRSRTFHSHRRREKDTLNGPRREPGPRAQCHAL